MRTRLVSGFSTHRREFRLLTHTFTELVHKALEAQMSLPVVLSHVDRRVNHSKKGKAREEKPSTEIHTAEESAPEPVDTTPADGVSDLAPAPTPEGLVPSSALPSQPAPPRVAFSLPEGVAIEECAIFYLGGESLGLNNLLMTHGKCSVRSPDRATRETEADFGAR